MLNSVKEQFKFKVLNGLKVELGNWELLQLQPTKEIILPHIKLSNFIFFHFSIFILLLYSAFVSHFETHVMEILQLTPSLERKQKGKKEKENLFQTFIMFNKVKKENETYLQTEKVPTTLHQKKKLINAWMSQIKISILIMCHITTHLFIF